MQRSNCIPFSWLSLSKQIECYFMDRNVKFIFHSCIGQEWMWTSFLFFILYFVAISLHHLPFVHGMHWGCKKFSLPVLSQPLLTHVELSCCFSPCCPVYKFVQCHFYAFLFKKKKMNPFVRCSSHKHKPHTNETFDFGMFWGVAIDRVLWKVCRSPVHLNGRHLNEISIGLRGYLEAIKRRIILPLLHEFARKFFSQVLAHPSTRRWFFHFTIWCTSLLLFWLFFFVRRSIGGKKYNSPKKHITLTCKNT